MKNTLLTLLLLFGLTTITYAATYEELYNCQGRDKDGTLEIIASVVPGKFYEESMCKMFNKSETFNIKYDECISYAREFNNKTLNLYKQGKCKKTGVVRASDNFNNTQCTIDYDLNKMKIVGSSYSTFSYDGKLEAFAANMGFGNSTNTENTTNNKAYTKTKSNICILGLLKELNQKYPNMKF